MSKSFWIEWAAAVGMLALASCAQSDLNQQTVEVFDERPWIQGVRAPFDLLATMENFTGGLGVSTDGTIRTNFAVNRNSLPWHGALDINAAKALKEVVAVHCQRARQVVANRAIVYGTFRENIAPRVGTTTNLNHTEQERRDLVANLYMRATGNRASDVEVSMLRQSLDEILRLVPNTADGTRAAMDVICTAIASSALGAVGY